MQRLTEKNQVMEAHARKLSPEAQLLLNRSL